MVYLRDQQIGTPMVGMPWPLVRLRLAERFGCAPRDIDAWGADEIGRVLELLTLEARHGRSGHDG